MSYSHTASLDGTKLRHFFGFNYIDICFEFILHAPTMHRATEDTCFDDN